MKKGIWWAQAGLALVLTLAIIGISMYGTLAFRPLYYHDMKSMELAKHTGYSEAEIRENYDALIDYNLAWSDGDLSFPTLPMSENGKTHFEEVKEIFDIFKYMAVFGGILGVAGIVFMARKKVYDYLKMTAITRSGYLSAEALDITLQQALMFAKRVDGAQVFPIERKVSDEIVKKVDEYLFKKKDKQ